MLPSPQPREIIAGQDARPGCSCEDQISALRGLRREPGFEHMFDLCWKAVGCAQAAIDVSAFLQGGGVWEGGPRAHRVQHIFGHI